MSSSKRTADASPLRVLQSFGTPRPRTNPYLTQLFTDIPNTVQRPFSWKTALFGRYDVFHVHFLEVVFLRRSRLKSFVGGLLVLVLLVRARLFKVAIVRTMHNTTSHEDRGRVTRAIDRLCARWTTLWIRLNPRSQPPAGAPVETILHPDYRDWFARWERSDHREGRLLFFGLIRPYKGVETLISRFGDTTDAALELRIVGHPDSPELAGRIDALQQSDDRVSVLLDYVDDETLAAEIGRSQLVVLPYLDMHNSGAALLALSLARPILVPDNPMNTDLAEEVGAEWVQRYSGELTAETLRSAVAAVAGIGHAGGHPDLSRRDWAVVRAEHAAAYRRAVALTER